MKWTERFTFVMRSSLTSLREKVEDPERMLHQLICDMDEELAAVRASVAAALADEIQLKKQVQQTRESVDEWTRRAAASLKRGDEKSARGSLDQKLRMEERLATLEETLQRQSHQTEKLRASYQELEDKIRQARHKRTLLVARLSQANSVRTIHSALDRAQGPSAFAEFSRMERKVERAEAMCEAYDQLEGRDPDADALAIKLAAEERREQLESEFAALKDRLSESTQ